MSQTSEEHDIRFTIAEDLPYLREWLMEPEMLHWFPMSPGKEMEESALGWIGFARFNASLTAMVKDEPCAMGTLFLMPYRKVAHECLIKMIVAPKWQRRGIGASLLKNLMNLARTRFGLEICYLELVEGNPLEKIAKSLGFTLAAKQEMYFKENGRYFARLLYDCDLNNNPFLGN